MINAKATQCSSIVKKRKKNMRCAKRLKFEDIQKYISIMRKRLNSRTRLSSELFNNKTDFN